METRSRKRTRQDAEGEIEELARRNDDEAEFLYDPDGDNLNIPYDPQTFNHGSDGYLWMNDGDVEWE